MLRKNAFGGRGDKVNAKCRMQNAEWASLHFVSFTRKNDNAKCRMQNAEWLHFISFRSQGRMIMQNVLVCEANLRLQGKL